MALAAAALLVAAGCGSGDAKDTATDAKDTMTSMMATTTTMPTYSAGHTTAASGAAEETKIATQGGDEVAVSGAIFDKYVKSGGQTGPLGVPEEAQESGPDGGVYQDFVGGTIYQAKDGAPYIVWGEIREAWEAAGGATGSLGYPTSDEKDIPGGKQSDFTGGTITWVDGQITVTEK
ncbi:esterase [Nocardia sp. NPDC050710]|uniref:LGFP repeat-containing protein n=1 Tax=Nocardia sp. NPDC050710 TaxID=3157220 RepID=UPI0033C70F17